MPIRSDLVLVLRRFPFGESSLIVHALSREFGRVHLLAKGAYRPKAAASGVLDVFDTLRLEWSHAPGRDLQTLRSGSIERRRAALSAELWRYRHAHTVLELAGLAAQPDAPARELFDAVELALDRLALCELPEHRALAEFEMRFLEVLGLAPALEICAACAREAPAVSAPEQPAQAEPPGARTARGARVAFSAGAGGRLCLACAREARRAGRRVGTLPEAVVLRASELARARAAAAPASAAELELVRDVLARFVEFHLESRPKTYQNFLAVPNRNRPREAEPAAADALGAAPRRLGPRSPRRPPR